METRFLFALIIALFVAGCGREKHAGPADYPIKLFRPQPVGSEHRVLVTGWFEETAEVAVDGKSREPMPDRYEFDIDVTAKILANDPKILGPILQLTFTKAAKTKNGQTEEIFTPGVVVVEKRFADKTDFFIGDSEVNATASRILRIGGLSMGLDPDSVDATYGSSERKRIGDSWPINTVAASVAFSRIKMPCKPENIAGKMTLKDVFDIGEQKMMRLESTTTLSRVDMEPPKGFTIRSCEGNSTSLQLMPVDVTRVATQNSTQLELNATFEREDAGRKVSLKILRKASHDLKVADK